MNKQYVRIKSNNTSYIAKFNSIREAENWLITGNAKDNIPGFELDLKDTSIDSWRIEEVEETEEEVKVLTSTSFKVIPTLVGFQFQFGDTIKSKYL